MTARTALLRLALIGGVFLSSTTALGQSFPTRIKDPEPARPADRVDADDVDEARRVMNDYARCIVESSRHRVESFLSTYPGSKESADRGSEIASSNCLRSGELRFQPSLFRGSLYEALYEKDYRRSRVADFSAVPALDYTAGRPAAEGGGLDQPAALRIFADCVARTDPASARGLILSEVASREERKAWDALTPKLGSCLGTGFKWTFSRSSLRALIAETLYRLTQRLDAMGESGTPAPAAETRE